jgi:hypothetical protein
VIGGFAGLHVGYFMEDGVDEGGWVDGAGKGFVDADGLGVVRTASGAVVCVFSKVDFPPREDVRCERFLQDFLSFADGSQGFTVDEANGWRVFGLCGFLGLLGTFGVGDFGGHIDLEGGIGRGGGSSGE